LAKLITATDNLTFAQLAQVADAAAAANAAALTAAAKAVDDDKAAAAAVVAAAAGAGAAAAAAALTAKVAAFATAHDQAAKALQTVFMAIPPAAANKADIDAYAVAAGLAVAALPAGKAAAVNAAEALRDKAAKATAAALGTLAAPAPGSALAKLITATDNLTFAQLAQVADAAAAANAAALTAAAKAVDGDKGAAAAAVAAAAGGAPVLHAEANIQAHKAAATALILVAPANPALMAYQTAANAAGGAIPTKVVVDTAIAAAEAAAVGKPFAGAVTALKDSLNANDVYLLVKDKADKLTAAIAAATPRTLAQQAFDASLVGGALAEKTFAFTLNPNNVFGATAPAAVKVVSDFLKDTCGIDLAKINSIKASGSFKTVTIKIRCNDNGAATQALIISKQIVAPASGIAAPQTLVVKIS